MLSSSGHGLADPGWVSLEFVLECGEFELDLTSSIISVCRM
jgi:hypothetical protein